METDIITGIVQHILFSSPDSAFTILKIVPDDSYQAQNDDGTATIVGEMPDPPRKGDAVEFEGGWTENPRYGMQFRMIRYQRVEKSAQHVPQLVPRENQVQGDKLAGTVIRITFYNADNSWGVIKIEPFDDADYPEEAIAYDGAIAVVGGYARTGRRRIRRIHRQVDR